MYWTKELPVKDGYYWMLLTAKGDSPRCTDVRQGLAYFPGQECPVDVQRTMSTLGYDVLWYGPLTPPPREST